ncbi:hypothetical protein [Nocardia transvalensis]|uniref:hypothetical protein n=1 Tax=Nocardia transvalensis TaxID=37333 RepID=UPI001894615E|nr:hypothetical protein [Nocardia transvalensis]MBF6328443.1 hypothetical protein [Nocardia transvalensis]
MISDDTAPSAATSTSGSDIVLPPLPADIEQPATRPPLLTVLASLPVSLSPQLTLILLLHDRLAALIADNARLRSRNRRLLVALDDCLDRESAHALCPLNERLAPPRAAWGIGSAQSTIYRSVSSCNRSTRPFSALA